MEKKRKPIRNKVRSIVLVISLVSLLITSTMGVLSMILIKSDSEDALIRQMEQNLHDIVTNKASLADSELGKYAGYIEDFARYINRLYKSPSAFVPNYVYPANPKNAGTFVMQRALVSRDYTIEPLMEEMSLLGNLEWMWSAAIPDGLKVITTVYIGTETGFLIGYDATSAPPAEGDIDDYYNYFESSWYKKARDTNGVCFTDAYWDSYDRGMTITCATPFYDAHGKLAGVVGMDILLTDLYREIVALALGEDAYAFLLDTEGNVIDPSAGAGENVRNIHHDDEIGIQIANRILNEPTGIALSNEDIYYAYTTIARTGWKLCIRVPESTALAPVRSMNRSIFITMLLFLFAFIIIIAFVALGRGEFSKRLTDPITDLEKDVRKISSGNLDYRAKIYDNDEIGDLAKAFNNMAVSLKEYVWDFASVTAERERMGTELNIATKIQADLLPCKFPPFPNRKEFEIYAVMHPAKEVGGDFYDFFFVDSDHLALIIADVSGKGVPSALFMAISKTLIKNRAQMGGTPSEILGAVNNQLCEESKSELFVTVWLGILEISTGRVIATNAGHEYPALRRAGGEYRLMKLSNSPAVATLEGITFRDEKFMLNPGDSLFLYTDGVAEATRVDGKREELYGTNRMIEALNRHADEPVEQLLASMRIEIDGFVGNSPQFDDLTMLALQYNGKMGGMVSR